MAKTSERKETRLEIKAAAIAACRDSAGRITPKAVVEAARDPASVLHSEFEWDVKKAAQREWERTASELIRQVKFVIQYEDRKVIAPYYVSDPTSDESGYVPVVSVAKKKSASRQMLRDELQRIKQAIHRAMTLAVAVDLVGDFEKMLRDVVEIETNMEGED